MSELLDRQKGEAICVSLKGMGVKPVWLEAAAGRIAIGVEFISAHPNWTRAFSFDAVHATPGAFVRMINEWKNKVRGDIVFSRASKVVQNAISAHGVAAVLDAMEDVAYDRVH